jgi:2,3-bisphosphoglycerate-independent phosphoglycerate mutase
MVLLLLLDGFGIAPAGEANAIAAAPMPVFSALTREYPVAVLAPGDKTLNARYLTLGAGQEIADENIKPATTLSVVLAAADLKQLKIAETERLAALTIFFNGLAEERRAGEDWKIISSASGAALAKPSLTLTRTVKEIVRALEAETPADFIAAAVPYLDLAAAGGDFAQVKAAAETLDKNLKTILAAADAKNGVVIISAAHGNAERMRNMAADMPDAGRTDNPVPFLIVGRQFKGKTIGLAEPLNSDLSLLAPAGTLADVAPTILRAMGREVPPLMTGRSLLD